MEAIPAVTIPAPRRMTAAGDHPGWGCPSRAAQRACGRSLLPSSIDNHEVAHVELVDAAERVGLRAGDERGFGQRRAPIQVATARAMGPGRADRVVDGETPTRTRRPQRQDTAGCVSWLNDVSGFPCCVGRRVADAHEPGRIERARSVPMPSGAVTSTELSVFAEYCGTRAGDQLAGRGGANVEQGIAPCLPGGCCGAAYCTTSSSGFCVSAGQRDPLTVLADRGSWTCLYFTGGALTCGFSIVFDLRSRDPLTIRQARGGLDDR
jgi:hypothetical protein